MNKIVSVRIASIVCLVLSITLIRAKADELRFPIERPFDVEHIRLDLDVDLDAKSVGSKATIFGRAMRPLDAITLDAVDFKDVSVTLHLDEKTSIMPEFLYDGRKLTIPFGRDLIRGEAARIEIDYRVEDPDQGLHFFKPSEEDPEAPFQVWSQGQSTSNRYWIPCFDHPNEMQTTEISCTVSEPYIAISNGELVDVSEADGGKRKFHWRMDKPHVAYLMTLVVGDFAKVSTKWRDIPVSFYVRPEFEALIQNSFGNTTKMMDFFSDKIGVAYPWPKYDQVCCYQFGGGMENTSSTTLGEGTLHDDRAHLDSNSDGLVAHELAHQWFGDLLTCNDWSHLWLNEGFASYFEALWDEHHEGEQEFAYNLMGKARRAMEGGKDVPVVDLKYPSPGRQFDARAYSKGAWVCHMLRRRLGEDVFWQGIESYVKQHAHQTVETSDLRRVLERVSGQSLSRFFHDWTERAGHPVVKVEYEWLIDEELVQLKVTQTQSGDPFHFPLELEFVLDNAESGATSPANKTITKLITEKETTIYVSLPTPPISVRVDPRQSVLMELTETKPMRLWMAQLGDPNPVLRIRAIRRVVEEGGDEVVQALASMLMHDSFWAVRNEAADALAKNGSDEARHALIAAINEQPPKVLPAVIDALSEFIDEPEVTETIRRFVVDGHESYKVQEAAIKAYATLVDDGDENALSDFRECLTRDSHRERIRQAALDAIARRGSAESIQEIEKYVAGENPIELRGAALEAIGRLADEYEDDDAVLETAVRLVEPALKSKNRRLLRSALSAAGKSDALALRVKSDLKAIAEDDESRLQWRAKSILDQIGKESEKDERVEKLEDEIKSLQDENAELKDRIKKLEAKQDAEPIYSH